MGDLFDLLNDNNAKLKPLAERMRAKDLTDFVGQSALVGRNSLLRRAIAADTLGNCIFYGPPGTGKTTLAHIIANITRSECVKMNAVLSGVAELRTVMDDAHNKFRMYGKKTVLILDECHRWNKAQSDALLAPIEEGYLVLIGTTTENPLISMTKAILSRCRIFKFERLGYPDVAIALRRAVKEDEIYRNMRLTVTDDAIEYIAKMCCGDLRTAYNSLELAVVTTSPDESGAVLIDKSVAEQCIDIKNYSVDESTFYDMLSAFCKSLRGSDADAAVYWSQRLISAGIDPLIVARRLVAHSAEDVGMADPMAMVSAGSAMTAVEKLGLPEGQIPLTEAIIYVAEASKSNAVVRAISAAEELVRQKPEAAVPSHLINPPYRVDYKGGYKYPHDFGGWVQQTYLPKEFEDAEIYVPSANGAEAKLIRAKKIKKNKG